MPKRPTYRNRAALVKALTAHTEEVPDALGIRLGGEYVPLPSGNVYKGVAEGKSYFAIVFGNDTILLAKNGKKFKHIEGDLDAETIAAIAADLLPEPEEPAEVVALREQLAAIKVPKGVKVVTNSKGGFDVIAEDGHSVGNGRRGGGGGIKTPLPRIEEGVKIKRLVGGAFKRDVVYTIVGIDMTAGTILLRSDDGHENEYKAFRDGKIVPRFGQDWVAA